MRYMIIVKATKDSGAGVLPPGHLLEEMAAYHGELAFELEDFGDNGTLDRFREIGLGGVEKLA